VSELSLKPSDPRFGLAPLSKVKAALDRLLGPSVWIAWEPETISLELGFTFNELLLDKIQVLQIIERDPELFFDDPAFTLYATEVINGNVADFDAVPMPTSLELAYAITEVGKVLGEHAAAVEFTSPIITVTAWLLRQEGYSEPVAPFDFVPAELLAPGQLPTDTEAKAKAIEAYIKFMEEV
jgi:hypothetical protein